MTGNAEPWDNDPRVVDAIRQVESSGGKNLLSPKGAAGSYGLMPVAAGGIDPYKDDQARKRAEEIMARNLAKFGDLDTALMAYHAGETGVANHLAGKPQNVSGVGPLTKAYPGKIRAVLAALNPIGSAQAAVSPMMPPPEKPTPPSAGAEPWDNDPVAPVPPVPPEKPSPPKSWGDTAIDAVSNIPSSAMEFGKAIVAPFTDPAGTAEGLKNLGLGIIQKIRNLSPERLRGSEGPFDEGTANAVGKHFMDRYGSMEGVQKAIGEDPVGVAADLSTILTGGGTMAAKLPGVAGKAGSAVAAVGKYTDPVNAVTAPLKAVEPIVSNVLGMTTGAGTGAIREAAAAGKEGGARQDALIGQMRKKEPIAAVVDSARDAIEEMRTQRGDAYRQGMAGVTKDPTVLDFKPIDDAVSKAASVGTFQGKTINPSATGTWEKINAAVDEWRQSDPATFHTVEGLDALKKKLGDIRDATDFGKPERIVADQVYRAVRGQIVQQAPAYGKIMKGYEEASDALRDIEKALSLGEKSSVDTAVRKLQSVMRNNANTNYGRRVEQAKTLEDYGAKDLFPQIAGQALSSATPRGLAGQGVNASAIAGAFFNPWTLGMMPFTSPHLVGEGALKAGQIARYPAKASPLVNALIGQPARTLMFNAGRLPGEGP